MEPTRRTVLGGVGTLVAGSLAGCIGEITADEGGFDSGYAAFFTLWDWSRQVGGDRVAFENPVDVGQLGHGWEPPGDLARDVATTDAFVYLDTPEFSWAQDLARTLEADYDDVAVIDGLASLDDQLLASGHDRGSDGTDEGDDGNHDHDDGDDHGNDHGDDHEGEGDHDERDGDGGEYHDPHVWVDPVLAREVVDTIAAGLGEADPDNAGTYRDNAAAYGERLDDLDGEFREMVEAADRDVAVLAGHDSFGYLEARYGFEVRTPVGVDPNAEPTPDVIGDTIEFVNDRGIDVILYDRFESPNLAETIVENSDATETLAVTPAGGTTAEWNERGWGYLDQMREVNLPAFGRALGAE